MKLSFQVALNIEEDYVVVSFFSIFILFGNDNLNESATKGRPKRTRN